MALLELTLRGFKGDTDATDHLILWVDTDMTEEQTKACLAEAELYIPGGIVSAVITVPDVSMADMAQADFVLPRDIVELKARATRLVSLAEAGRKAFADILPELDDALLHASQSEHHPRCGLKKNGIRCTCHVQKCKDALAALRETGEPRHG